MGRTRSIWTSALRLKLPPGHIGPPSRGPGQHLMSLICQASLLRVAWWWFRLDCRERVTLCHSTSKNRVEAHQRQRDISTKEEFRSTSPSHQKSNSFLVSDRPGEEQRHLCGIQPLVLFDLT
ncbi:hypothetical protein JTE90_026151 [Oedothorax gibbosus]|uniref:Uncharacterized protein n=1 Tax=Oedothorax gibbosus TaxID=931172 RepID=A0AAV6UZL0_9ARAC|nr:hypothetical protein JTE90_026151 [Oedothorax gibbosus]